jgi:hypothetical protein
MDPAEGRRRMRALRRQVLTHDVDRWARSFLAALHPSEVHPDVHPDLNHDGHDGHDGHDSHDSHLAQMDESGPPERVIDGVADPSME